MLLRYGQVVAECWWGWAELDQAVREATPKRWLVEMPCVFAAVSRALDRHIAGQGNPWPPFASSIAANLRVAPYLLTRAAGVTIPRTL
jgi:hypothetical protein